MTTIATDGRLLAGDGQSTRGDTVVDQGRVKVHRLPDGSIVGAAGRMRDAHRALMAMAEGVEGEFPGEYTLMRLTKKGHVEVYEGSLYTPVLTKPPYAIGSGADVAMGAMLAGADANEALRIASKLDVYTGGKITSYSR